MFSLHVRRQPARASILAVAALVLGMPVGRAAESPSNPAASALIRLKDGNARFAADPITPLPLRAGRREALRSGQDPFALVLSCADSRVPPEVIFNTGLGDLFVVRTAGEVLDRSILASLEYGAEHLDTPLLVVMGHEFCGAVKAATEASPTSRPMGPNLDFLIKSIQPAVARSAQTLFEEPLKAAVLANVEQVVAELQAQSAILRQRVQTGELQIIGAYYELSSGRVNFSQPVGGVRPAPAVTTQSPAVTTRPPAVTTRSPGKPLIEIHEPQPRPPGGASPAKPKPH